MIEPLRGLNVSRIETLVFAGGGNRCWWQGGVIDQWLNEGWRIPDQLVGTSAGAGVAASCLTDGPRTALEACLQLFRCNPRIYDWQGQSWLRLRFAHEHIYPKWIAAFVNHRHFETLRNGPKKLRVAFARPSRWLGVVGSVCAGTLAYVVDKYLFNSIHPRLPRFLGLRQAFLDVHECATIEDTQLLLAAAAAAPPFMPARRVAGSIAIDGGYVDNAPIHAQNAEDKSKTLVLLTRHYPKLPSLFRWHGRTYWQPSRRVPVSTWDCTERTTVCEAFELGLSDARRAIRSSLIRCE